MTTLQRLESELVVINLGYKDCYNVRSVFGVEYHIKVAASLAEQTSENANIIINEVFTTWDIIKEAGKFRVEFITN